MGARPQDLYGIVFRQAMIPVGIGLTAGIAASLLAGRVLASLLFEVSFRDPIINASVAGILLAVALAACFVPARRAVSESPLEALRHE